MIYKISSFTLIIIFTFICSSQAYAQSALYETKQYSSAEERVFDLPPPDEIPQEFLEEMDRVYYECGNDIYNAGHRDCRCYAMAFLEERLKLKNVSQKIIETALFGECFDFDKMKGFYFGQCASKINPDRVMTILNKDPNEVCECYANKVPELLLSAKIINSQSLTVVRKQAHVDCGLL